MSQYQDTKLLNVPALLEQRVWVEGPDGQMVADHDWRERTRERLESLYQFHRTQGLLANEFNRSAPALDDLVLCRGDLTPAGWAFWQTGAVDRWLGSFDRSPGKSPSNRRILEVALAKINAAAA